MTIKITKNQLVHIQLSKEMKDLIEEKAREEGLAKMQKVTASQIIRDAIFAYVNKQGK